MRHLTAHHQSSRPSDSAVLSPNPRCGISGWALTLLMLGACGGAEQTPVTTPEPSESTVSPPASTAAAPQASGTPIAQARGHFSGTYEVPVPSALAGAASYTTESIDWVMGEGSASLDYDLPAELLGKQLRISFTGTFDVETQTAALTSEQGTAKCTIENREVTCHEDLSLIAPLPVDQAALERITERLDPALVNDRITIANKFAHEPLGILRFTLP